MGKFEKYKVLKKKKRAQVSVWVWLEAARPESSNSQQVTSAAPGMVT